MFYERCPCRCPIPRSPAPPPTSRATRLCFVLVKFSLGFSCFSHLFLGFPFRFWALVLVLSSVHVPENRIYLIRTVNFQHLELNRRTFSAAPIAFPTLTPPPRSFSDFPSLSEPLHDINNSLCAVNLAKSLWLFEMAKVRPFFFFFVSSVADVDVHYF